MSKSKPGIRSALKRVDRHVIQSHEYEEAPELTDDQLERAVVSVGGRPVGRPRMAQPKQAVKIRLDASVLIHFRSTGPGWQTRINETLLRATKRAKAKMKA